MVIKIHRNSEDSFATSEYYELDEELTNEELEDLVRQDAQLSKGEIEQINWRGKQWDQQMGMEDIFEQIGRMINPTVDKTIVVPCYSEACVADGDVEGK